MTKIDVDKIIDQVVEGKSPIRAMSASSINVMSNSKSTLLTHMLAESRVVLAKVRKSLKAYGAQHMVTEEVTELIDETTEILESLSNLKTSVKSLGGFEEGQSMDYDDESDDMDYDDKEIDEMDDMDDMDYNDDEYECKYDKESKDKDDDDDDDSDDDDMEEGSDKKKKKEGDDDDDDEDDDAGKDDKPKAIVLKVKGVASDDIEEFTSELQDLIAKYDGVSDDDASEMLTKISAKALESPAVKALLR